MPHHQSQLGYTIDDDGVHLYCAGDAHDGEEYLHEVANLGHSPSIEQVQIAWAVHLADLDTVRKLTPEEWKRDGRVRVTVDGEPAPAVEKLIDRLAP